MTKITRYLAVLCLLNVCGLLVAGLGHRTRNQVTWLPEHNGIAFGLHGVALASVPRTQARDSSSCSVELWMKAADVTEAGTMLAFYSAEHDITFRIRHSWTDIELRRAETSDRDARGLSRAIIDRVLRPGMSAFLTISSGTAGTELYLDGILKQAIPRLKVSEADCTGQLVLGGSPRGGDLFVGWLRGLAIYPRALSRLEVSRHFHTWVESGRPDYTADETVRALYLFAEHSGNIAHSAQGAGVNLFIPERYMVVDEILLEAPWNAFTPTWGYWEDIVINICGFIPLGLVLCVYISLVWTQRWALALTVTAGAALSLTIEIAQAHLPTRNSDLTDVITNTLGTFVGALFCRWVVGRLREWNTAGVLQSATLGLLHHR